jgi:hypothetical protein
MQAPGTDGQANEEQEDQAAQPTATMQGSQSPTTEDRAGMQQQPTTQPAGSAPDSLPLLQTGTATNHPVTPLAGIVLGFGLVAFGFILLTMMQRRK